MFFVVATFCCCCPNSVSLYNSILPTVHSYSTPIVKLPNSLHTFVRWPAPLPQPTFILLSIYAAFCCTKLHFTAIQQSTSCAICVYVFVQHAYATLSFVCRTSLAMLLLNIRYPFVQFVISWFYQCYEFMFLLHAAMFYAYLSTCNTTQ